MANIKHCTILSEGYNPLILKSILQNIMLIKGNFKEYELLRRNDSIIFLRFWLFLKENVKGYNITKRETLRRASI